MKRVWRYVDGVKRMSEMVEGPEKALLQCELSLLWERLSEHDRIVACRAWANIEKMTAMQQAEVEKREARKGGSRGKTT